MCKVNESEETDEGASYSGNVGRFFLQKGLHFKQPRPPHPEDCNSENAADDQKDYAEKKHNSGKSAESQVGIRISKADGTGKKILSDSKQ
jgi:hypothetical protein